MRSAILNKLSRFCALCAAMFVAQAAAADGIEISEETVGGSDSPVAYHMVETWDGLYTPIALRRPDRSGDVPIILFASGNGGEGLSWLRDATANRSWTQETFLNAGYAVAWLRYRAEVDLGYAKGGAFVEDERQGRQLLNRSPLEYEDVIAVIEYVKMLPGIDPERIGYVGLSHGGEMALKIASEYHGLAAAIASEPAAHEFLALAPDESASVNRKTELRNLEKLQMSEVERVKARIDHDLAQQRIATIETPLFVMGRDGDHLQGIFRATYDLLEEAGKEATWKSYDHGEHGFIYPRRSEDGQYAPDDMQRRAVADMMRYFEDQFAE